MKPMSSLKIARLLRDHEDGISLKAIARRHGITIGHIGFLTRQYSGLDAKWIETIRRLEHQLTIMTNRVEKLSSYIDISRQVIKRMQPAQRPRSVMAATLRANFGIPHIAANRIVGLSPSAGSGKVAATADANLIADMKRYFEQNPGQGFHKVFNAILKDQPNSRKACWLTYKATKLELPGRGGKRAPKLPAPARIRKRMQAQTAPNDMWSMDFMADGLFRGKRYWILNIIDDFNREALLTHPVVRQTTSVVVRCLERLHSSGRVPKAIWTDNGSVFKASEYVAWMKRIGAQRVYGRPYVSADNSLIERFNGTLRKEVLDRYELHSMVEVSRMLEDWRTRYNLSRPHYSLGGLSPLQYSALVKPKVPMQR